MVRVPPCPLCAGRRPFCIHKSYPIPRPDLEKTVRGSLKRDFFGPSYSVFVGKSGYPNVFAGPMVGMQPLERIDSPDKWFGMDYSNIIELRSFLLRSKRAESIFSRSRHVREMQELVLAKKATDVEMSFRRTPSFSLSISESFQPMGPSGLLEKMRVAENVSVRPRVERIVSDELKSQEQVSLLHGAGMDVYKISSVFSSGALGLQGKRKLVPSRWSVTGIDDILAKSLLEKVRTCPEISDFLVFGSSYLDNHFVILLMPGSWEFENFEVWAPSSNWSSQTQSRIIPEYEPFQGRSDYAESQAGGYYAARISAVKYLVGIRRQARVVSFREVYEGYTVPLGVWVVRETSGNAFKERPRKFQTKESALTHVGSRLKLPLKEYVRKSKILRQKRLGDF